MTDLGLMSNSEQTVFKPSRQFRTTVRSLTVCMSNRYKENQMV